MHKCEAMFLKWFKILKVHVKTIKIMISYFDHIKLAKTLLLMF